MSYKEKNYRQKRQKWKRKRFQFAIVGNDYDNDGEDEDDEDKGCLRWANLVITGRKKKVNLLGLQRFNCKLLFVTIKIFTLKYL